MNEIMVVEKPEIQVIEFEPSDVLRQRRLENQLLKKDIRDEIIFRRVMIGACMVGLTIIGFVVGQIVAASMLLL